MSIGKMAKCSAIPANDPANMWMNGSSASGGSILTLRVLCAVARLASNYELITR